MNPMNWKIRILTTTMAMGLAVLPGLSATESNLTESLEGDADDYETSTQPDLWEIAESITACVEEEDSEDSSNETQRTEGSNETSTDPSDEGAGCIVDDTKESLKKEFEDLPEWSYCKRFNGRMTCVGFNDHKYCDAYVYYGYLICLPIWRDL